MPTPNCLLNDKSSSHFATRHLSHFCDNCNLVSIQFSQLKVWKPLHRCLDYRSLLLIFWKSLYHWFITWLQRFFQTMSLGLLLLWLCIWIYLINKPLSMQIYWLHLIKVMIDVGFMWCDPYSFELLTYRFYKTICHNVL